MHVWSEQSLREAASWQAFKEGNELFRAGAVGEVKSGEAGWQGSVRGGTRPFRVKVTARSATDLDARCSCPENQRSGTVCAHAVATGLAALVPRVGLSEIRESEPASSAVRIAWDLAFPASWRKALGMGRLSVAVQPSDGAVEPELADDRLSDWMAKYRLDAGRSHTLALQGDQLAEFLAWVVDHPRVKADGVELAFSQGGRLRLADIGRGDDGVNLVPDGSDVGWQWIGGRFWKFSDAGGIRVGEGEIPADVADGLRRLAEGKLVECSIQHFLSQWNDWREVVEFPQDAWTERLHIVPAPHEFGLSLDGSARQLKAELRVSYAGLGECVPGMGNIDGLPRLECDTCLVRDGGGEADAVRQLESAGFVRGEGDAGAWRLTGDSAVLGFLTGMRSWLRHEWKWTESTAVRRIAEETAIVMPRIDVRGAGEDWLSFAVNYRTEDGEPLDPAEVRRLIQGARVTTKRGKVCRLAEGVAQAWEPLLADLDARQEGDLYRVDARAGMVVEEIRRRFAAKDAEIPDESAFSLPDSFTGTLRPYQAQGVAWLDDRTTRFGGAILADDMGLGKTVQTIVWAESLLEREPDARILVLATTSLLGNWCAEWRKFAPQRTVRILHGAGREGERGSLGAGEIWLTSHSTLVRDLAWYLRQEFAALVVDEASLLRNPDTDQAKAVRKIQARCKIALTGTPVENSVRDLWSLFSWVQPGWLGTREAFHDRYETAAKSEGAERELALTHLRIKSSPFILRRTKEKVAPELPSKIIINEFCELSGEQAKLYAELAREGRRIADASRQQGANAASRMAVLTTLLRLRQTCCDPSMLGIDSFKHNDEKFVSCKHQRLHDLLNQSFDGNHKVLVFSQFRKQLLGIEKKIKAAGWDCLRLDGQTRNRSELVDRFQSEAGPPVFLISLKAGGYGLNLTAADVVIHLDPWWNPAVEDQANDRAHRIGQVRPVTVYRLLTRGTVEEAVLRLQERKRSLAGVIDESGAGDPAGWTMADLCELV
jgi:superfamily II DNA or RNA helicase